MSVQDFIQNAHPDTIKWMEREVMDKLERVDYLNKMNQAVREVREAIKDAT